MQKRMMILLLLMSAVTIQAMDGEQRIISLKTNDGHIVEVPKNEACKFGVLAKRMGDADDGQPKDAENKDTLIQLAISKRVLTRLVDDAKENVAKIPRHASVNTFNEYLAYLKGADYLQAPENVVRDYSKIVADLIFSPASLLVMHANPTGHPVCQLVQLSRVLQEKINDEISPEWKLIHEIQHGYADVESVAFSADSNYLATATDKKVRIIAIDTGAVIREIAHDHDARGVAFSEDSNYFATRSKDNKVRIIAIHGGKAICEIQHDDCVSSVVFSPNNNYLATGSYDKKVRVIRVETGEMFHELDHGTWVMPVAFSPNSNYVATGSIDGKVRIIEVNTGKVIQEIEHGHVVRSVVFSPDNNYLATGSSNKKARIIEVNTGSVVQGIEHGAPVWVVAYSPDGNYLATGSIDAKVRIIEVNTGKVLRLIELQGSRKLDGYINLGDSIRLLMFSPGNQYLVIGSDYNKTCIIDVYTGKVIDLIEHRDYGIAVAYSPDGNYLAKAEKHTYKVRIFLNIKNSLRSSLKNSLLIAYLHRCVAKKMQPHKQGWVKDAIDEYPDKDLLEKMFPGINVSEKSSYCSIV